MRAIGAEVVLRNREDHYCRPSPCAPLLEQPPAAVRRSDLEDLPESAVMMPIMPASAAMMG